MKASETNLLKFLQGTKQFIIPIYQRKYSWNISQCKQLWEDIVRASTDDDIKGHFVGSVVYIERGLYQISAVPQLLVIDGQQRLTTMTLLLMAFGKALKESDEKLDITSRKVQNYYLVNNDEEDELYHKLLLTERDKETLLNMVNDHEIPQDYSPKIVENYEFFENAIRKSGLNLNQLYQGLSKLIIVDISLDRDHDNPQLIFESLNSTGLELSQADLIRNYILMRMDPKEQERLYLKYWSPMEKSFEALNETSSFDRFMRDYLTIKTGKIPIIRDVYADFKDYIFHHQNLSIEEVLQEVYQYSKFFVRLALQVDEDEEINNVLKDINSLKVDVSYPFLIKVYEDYNNQKVSKEDFISILRLVESYVFRRAIVGVPTNSLNKTFATMKNDIDYNNYLESIQVSFLTKDSYRRFPNNEEFLRELEVKDVYNFRSRNYLLRKLENYEHKEIVNIEAYTIEHILPQNKDLADQWRQQLGPNWRNVQEKYLHTLGNLTLTGYNSEMSDRPFNEKRDMEKGFADSKLSLNKGLEELDYWNEEEIIKRGRNLAEKALKIWSYPAISNEVLSRYQEEESSGYNNTYDLINFPELNGEMLELFEQLRKRICNLDSSVREEIKKRYIAYKVTTNFVDIIPQKSRLRLTLNMPFNEIHDPKGICRDITNVGKWGNGNVETGVSSLQELNDVMYLIYQSFEKHRDEED